MNDAGDLLLRARLATSVGGGDDGDWSDVVRRVRRARRRRAVVAAGAAALVVAGVASALALTHPTVDFGSAEKGPESVVVDFGRQNVIAPDGMKPGILPEQARRITTVRIDGKPHTLFVAPTASGMFCWQWSNHGGSCRQSRTDAYSKRIGGGGLGSPHGYSVLEGAFLLDGTRLEVAYADGEKADVPFVWVTEPIDAGFYLFDVPKSHQRAGHEAVSLTLYDADGKTVAVEKLPTAVGSIPVVTHKLPGFGWINSSPGAIYAERELLFDVVLGPHRHYGLWIAPSSDGGTCWWSNTGGGCNKAGESPTVPPELAAKHPELKEAGPLVGLGMHGGNPPSLCCEVDTSTARVELRYQDGTRETAIPKRGYLLIVIAPEHYPLGHRLKELVAYDKSGKVVGRRDMTPEKMRAVYPCEHEKDYGYGVTMCP